ncbi:MAG: sensor histidine kinase [Rhodospirillaceae bacterium]|nr:sensor histidine kinase [Rhodospirillaceae bacterium]
MRANSLALRLVAGAAVWVGAALAVCGVLLSNLFSDYVERSFDSRLDVLLQTLVAASEIGSEGRIELTRATGEPRFEQIYSGWYWQIADAAATPVLRSRSLFDQTLPLAAQGGQNMATFEFNGPEGRRLRVYQRTITLPGGTGPFRYSVAGDRSEIVEDVAAFNAALVPSLGALGIGLLVAVFVQVHFGLQPLRRIGAAIADVRAGRARRLEGRFPAEIAPLSNEINILLEHDAQVLERARTQVGNLAHALKTPLSVLINDAAAASGPLAESIRRQAGEMRRQIDHHLARARTAGAGKVLGARTEVLAVAENLRRTLARIHVEKSLDIELAVAPGAAFRGERQDLEEMLGNLMDNACKWARSRVVVSTRQADGRLCLVVDDDGPGLTEEERQALFRRGTRLDESVPGTGLGLAIVRDMAEVYGGAVALERAPAGGVRAVLDLPAA